MGSIQILKDERDKPNIQITHQDRRSPHVLHGYRNDDPKIKVVKIGISLPRPQNYLQIKQGNKVYEQEANSPVLNYYKRLICMIGGVSQAISPSFEIRKQDNTLYTGDYIPAIGYFDGMESYSGAGYTIGANNSDYGIVLGTDNTAWDFDNYIIGSKIEQGTAAGKLVYSGSSSFIVSYLDSVWTVIRRRVFDNFNSDANTITVKEIVQFVPLWRLVVQFVYIDERTVLETPKDIPYKSGAVFTYINTVIKTSDLTSNGMSRYLSVLAGVETFDSTGVYGAGHRVLKNTAGSLSTYPVTPHVAGNAGSIVYNGLAGILTKGTVVGYGTTAVADTDYILESQFEHGNNVNQLSYQAQASPVAVYDSVSKTFTVTQTRTVTNNYAGAQTISEIGIISKCNDSNSWSFLMSRTVLGSPVVLAQDESAALVHDFNLAHP